MTVQDGEGAWALLDDVLFLGSDETAVTTGIDAVNDATPSLEDAEAFTETTTELPGDRLALVYADLEGVLEGMASAADIDPADLPASGATRFGMTVAATPEGLAFDAVTVSDTSALDAEAREALDAPDEPNLALDSVTSDTFFVIAQRNVDVAIETGLEELGTEAPEMLEQLDGFGVTGPGGLLETLSGDLAISLQPGGEPVDGVISMGIDDRAAAEQAIDRIVSSLDLGAETVSESEGIQIYGLRVPPLPIVVAVSDDLAFIGTSPVGLADAIAVATDRSGLVADDRYAETVALVDASDSLFYTDVAAIVRTVRDAIPPSEQEVFDQDVAPYLEPIDRIVAGASGDATTQHARFV